MPIDTPTSRLLAGARDIAPMLLGVVPFGLIAGMSAVSAGLSPIQAAAMSVIAFAGASQLAAFQLISLGAAAPVVVLTTFVINLRFVMYSASIAPHFKHLRIRWRLLLAYLLTDQGYALSIVQFDQDETATHNHWYYVGIAAVLWTMWQACTVIGAYAGAQVPASWSLDFAVPLVFLAVVVPIIRDRALLVAALCAGSVAVAAAGLPYNLGLIVGAAAGILAGVLVELGQERKKAS